jgi:hypothetical protein
MSLARTQPPRIFICDEWVYGIQNNAERIKNALNGLNEDSKEMTYLFAFSLFESALSEAYRQFLFTFPEKFSNKEERKIDTEERQSETIEIKNVPFDFDTGFRVLKLADTNMNDVYYAAGDYTQNMLLFMQDNIKPDRTDMDLLFGCLLGWGLPLSMPHTHEVIDGATVHTYNGGDLIACFALAVSETVVREIAKRQPLRAVFRDSSFTSSPEKINVTEIFKLLAPNTTVKVI